MRSRHSTLIASLAVAVTVLSAGVAHAAWVKTGAGSGVTSATSLVTPALTAARSATSPTSAIDLSWTDAGQLAGTTYQVRRDGTLIGCSSSPCTDSGLAANTTYSYVVTAQLGQWIKASAAASAGTATAATPATTYSLVATPGSITAGTSTSVVITAKRTDGTTDTSYTGAKPVTWSGAAFATSPGGTAPSAASSVTFTSGVSEAVPVTLTTAGTGMTLTATSPGSPNLDGSTNLTVVPGAPARLGMASTSWSGGTSAAGCTVFACLRSGLGNNGSVTTNVSVTDVNGNIVSNLGTAITVVVSRSGGTLTAPPSSTPSTTVTLTIPGSGTAVSNGTAKLTEGTANYESTLTATSQSPAYASASTTIKKT